MVLCANKTDLPAEMWEVSREQFNLFAEENKLAIFEASASSGAKVEEVIFCLNFILLIFEQVFTAVGQLVLENNRSNLTEMKESDNRDIVVFDLPPQKSTGCCVVS